MVPESVQERNARKWSIRAETYNQGRFGYFRWMQQKALAFLDIAPGVHFLDVGCGTGHAVRLVAATVGFDGVFCGIDISPRMIEVARQDSAGLRNVRFEVTSADKLPLSDGYVDAVLCTNSFHHYERPLNVLEEIRRVLKPGGRLCILDVTADNHLVRWINGRTQRKEPEHVSFYSSREYMAMVGEAGLKLVMSRTILPPMKVHIAER